MTLEFGDYSIISWNVREVVKLKVSVMLKSLFIVLILPSLWFWRHTFFLLRQRASRKLWVFQLLALLRPRGTQGEFGSYQLIMAMVLR